MACITLGTINKKYIAYPILGIIVLIINNFFTFKTSFLKYLFKHPLIKIINKSLGLSLSFIFYVIYIVKNNLEEKTYNKEYIKKLIKIKHKKYYFLLISTLIGFIYNLLYCIFGSFNDGKFFSLWIFDIIYISIFSYFILKLKLYKHRYFSIIIFIILAIISNVINTYDKEKNLTYLILLSLVESLFSLEFVLYKYLMDNLFCTTFEICFFRGLIGLFLSIICLIIFTNKNIEVGVIEYKGKKYLDNFYEYIDNFNIKEAFVFIFEAIYYLISNLFFLLTIEYYTIFHIFILLIFDEGNYFLNDFQDWKLYINILIYIIFLFMMLIFNENIELNFCGLEKNTKKNIIPRASSKDNSNKMNIEEQILEIGNYTYRLDYEED